jgi:hypothetical protein
VNSIYTDKALAGVQIANESATEVINLTLSVTRFPPATPKFAQADKVILRRRIIPRTIRVFVSFEEIGGDRICLNTVRSFYSV